MFRGRVRQAHFVGIGGIGMSGLAEILRSLSFGVSGSDLRASEVTRRLESLGVRVAIGHRAENVAGADVVIVSSAVASDNPEIVAARAGHIPVISRGEMLAELMRVKYAVVIAGSHGKTTTTSLVATILRSAALDPTVIVGGRMASLGSNAQLGASELLVAEADESDGSFLRLTPTIAVVTNIDPEHLDFYGDYDRLKSAFLEFAEKVPFYGLGVFCLDHPAVQSLLPQIERRHVTYGLSPQADYSAHNIQFEGLKTSFEATALGRPMGRVVLNMPGQHNVQNCLSAIAVADELGVSFHAMKQALSSFDGVARRFTVVDTVAGITLVDDYGHHPAEIRATLDAARSAYTGRVVVAFQPHRYTRTRALLDEFARSFNKADVVFLTDVYPAGEAPIPGVDGVTLAKRIADHGHHAVSYISEFDELARAVASEARPGDVVIALGAGSINRILESVRTRLRARAGLLGGKP